MKEGKKQTKKNSSSCTAVFVVTIIASSPSSSEAQETIFLVLVLSHNTLPPLKNTVLPPPTDRLCYNIACYIVVVTFELKKTSKVHHQLVIQRAHGTHCVRLLYHQNIFYNVRSYNITCVREFFSCNVCELEMCAIFK